MIFTIAPRDQGCAAGLRITYLGHTPVYGWAELPSNGSFENIILNLVDAKVKHEKGYSEGGATSQTGQETPITNPRPDLPKTITVRFASTPSNAEVQVDGEYWGSTPIPDIKRLAEGPHTVLIKKPGYLPWERKISLAGGDDRTISAELEAQPVDPSKPRISGNR